MGVLANATPAPRGDVPNENSPPVEEGPSASEDTSQWRAKMTEMTAKYQKEFNPNISPMLDGYMGHLRASRPHPGLPIDFIEAAKVIDVATRTYSNNVDFAYVNGIQFSQSLNNLANGVPAQEQSRKTRARNAVAAPTTFGRISLDDGE